MKKLIDKFYSYSPFKRIVISICLVLLISGLMAGYSFYSLSKGVKDFWNEEGTAAINKERKLVILASRAKDSNHFISDEVTNALKAYDKLARFDKKYSSKTTSTTLDKPISGEQIAEIEQTIEAAIKFKLEHCLLFSNIYMHLGRSMALNLKHIRQIVRFLTKYMAFRKNNDVNYDVTNIVQSIETLNRLIQTSVPFLIGKMMSVGVSNLTVEAIHKLLVERKLSVKEATQILSVIKNSCSTMQSFKQSMKNEFVYFQQFRGMAYTKAPFACWLLDTAFGDPSKKYADYINNDYTKAELLEKMNKEKHIMLMLLMPNFRKAREKSYASVALQIILCQELSDYIGLNESYKDPYLVKNNLRSIQKDGKKVYYAVGMDEIGNECQGDDIWIDEVVRKGKY